MTGEVVFARPEALWALALALPVLLAHLYRRRRRRVVVAFAPLVREAVGPARARGAWRRVREAARLLARVVAVAALALALAGPAPARAQTPPTDLVVVLDADVTTSVVEPAGGALPGRTRFQRGLALARAHVLAHAGGRVGAVLAGPAPVAVAAPSEDRGAVVAALGRADLGPRPGRADLAAAVAAARGARGAGRALRVVVVTSRALPAGAEAPDVEAVGAGVADDDQGFVDAALERPSVEERATLRLVVRNAADAPRRRTVRVEREARGDLGAAAAPGRAEVATHEVELPARGEVEVRLPVPDDDAGLLVASLSGPDDAWDVDDRVVVGVPPSRRPSVLVAHGGTPRPFLRALLEALGDAIDRAGSGYVEARALATARPRDVLIVDAVALPAGAWRGGAAVFLAPFPGGDGLPFQVGPPVVEPLVWRAASGHPLLRGVDLSTAYVARAFPLRGEGVRALASVEGEAVVAEGERDGRRWLAFGLDPDGSDLPLRAALPVLLRNAVRRLGEAPLAPLAPVHRTGTPVAPRAPLLRPDLALWAEGRAGRGATPAATWRPARWAPDEPAGVVAPTDGAYALVARTADGGTFAAGVAPLDRALDVRPVRPAAEPPPPAPPEPEDDAARWLRWLLWVAGGGLTLDLLLGAVGRRNVARPSREA